MITTLLVPLDGSQRAESALPFALRLAHRLDANLLLVSVVKSERGLRQAEAELTEIYQDEHYLETLRQRMSHAAGDASVSEDRIVTLAELGDPASSLAQTATQRDASLIVMATHNRTGLARLIEGSVAAYVVRHAHRPVVLIVPRLDENHVEGDVQEQNGAWSENTGPILVALDGSIEAEAILDPAIAVACQMGLPMALLRVVTPADAAPPGIIPTANQETTQAQTEQEAAAYLAQIHERVVHRGPVCTQAVQAGFNVADTLVAYALHIHAPIIALASHARGRVGSFLLGNITDAVLQQSPVPVLTTWSTAQAEVPAQPALAGV